MIWVIAFHSTIQEPELFHAVRGTVLGNVIMRGGLGVDLFFVLSGYLIGGQLIRRIRERGDPDLVGFYFKRAMRIFPPYYLVLLLIVVVLLDEPFYEFFLLGLDPHDVLRGAWANAVYLNNYTGSRVMPWGWSLCVEEHFYFAVPLLLWLLLRRFGHETRLTVLWVLFAVPWVCRLLAWRDLGIDPIQTGIAVEIQPETAADVLRWMNAIFLPTHCRFEGLVVGVLIAYTEQTNPAVARRWAGWWGAVLTALSVAAFALYLFARGGNAIGPGASLILFGPMTLACGGLIQNGIYRPRSGVARFLSLPCFYPVARVSYGMYLVHPFLIAMTERTPLPAALRHLGSPGMSLVAIIALNSVIAYAAGVTMFTVWEWRFLSFRDRVMARRRARQDREGGSPGATDGRPGAPATPP